MSNATVPRAKNRARSVAEQAFHKGLLALLALLAAGPNDFQFLWTLSFFLHFPVWRSDDP
jgi:hypothetical protein